MLRSLLDKTHSFATKNLRGKKCLSPSLPSPFTEPSALHRALRPMIELRHFSYRPSFIRFPKVFAPKTLTPSRILSPIRRTDGDENLLRVMEAELPKDWPFEIIDKPGIWLIKLKREFQGEKIIVCVYKSFDGDADEEKSEQDAAEGQNTDDGRQPYISVLVTIDKAGTALKFWCNLYAKDLEILRAVIRRPFDSNEGFDYSGCIDLDEGLQKAFNEYLGARGIKVLYKFLREYFVRMNDSKYIDWWKNLNEHLEN